MEQKDQQLPKVDEEQKGRERDTQKAKTIQKKKQKIAEKVRISNKMQ